MKTGQMYLLSKKILAKLTVKEGPHGQEIKGLNINENKRFLPTLQTQQGIHPINIARPRWSVYELGDFGKRSNKNKDRGHRPIAKKSA
jgi:hypothetical protein